MAIFSMGKGLGRGPSEGERFNGGQVTAPLPRGRLLALYLTTQVNKYLLLYCPYPMQFNT